MKKNEIRKIEIKDPSGIPEAATRLLEEIGDAKVVAFDAPMGAGKTTLISAMCRHLGVEDDISSPTFAIVNDYTSTVTGEHIYHFDCYRIEDPSEAEDMGAEDYFYSGNRCFIEWPDRIEAFLPDETVRVAIRVNSDDSREIEIF